MNLTTLAVAMRAANVADVYMTKYQSEAQEKLGPILSLSSLARGGSRKRR